MGRDGAFPKNLSYLGFLSAALLIVIYVARLTILTSTSPLVLVPAALSGFVVAPAFSIWLGMALLNNSVREP
jgi:hypothetical protein